MRRRALLALLLLASAPLAGCFGSGDEAQVAPTGSTTDDPGPASGGQGTFVVENVLLLPEDGRERTAREDDALVLSFRVRVPADAPGETTGFVTILVNGEIARSENLRLQPGESRDLEHRVEDLAGLDAVETEIRALSGRGEARMDVLPWPRAGDYEGIEGLGVIVHRWSEDLANGTTVVNASFVSEGPAFSTLRLKLLCATPEGVVEERGHEELAPPQMGTPPVDAEVAFPRCADGETTYGVQATARDETGQEAAYARVLFVPEGWAPAASPQA